MPSDNKGTDPKSIAARLRERYFNLSSPFLKDVTHKKSLPSKLYKSWSTTELEAEEQEYHEFERGLHISSLGPEFNKPEEQPKLKYELAEDYKSSKHCICMRSNTAYECDRCHQYFYGRLSEICEKHPQEFFLMDNRSCPFCNAPIEMIKKSPISWETIRKIEDAELPSDGDL
ncbi:uncharacterized protein CG13380 [Drosophila yakuba]|uniref:Uncharacterized protein n=1 Tax=Drosophila yakuba TaxID=7245 RepID=B4PJ10_DROYA|nr:uncharacterized protein CG13380 [Drosophila yakuba]EDW94601.1 uncharacterized protein Dyak_GE22067 [Drosophila yakuba]